MVVPPIRAAWGRRGATRGEQEGAKGRKSALDSNKPDFTVNPRMVFDLLTLSVSVPVISHHLLVY